MDRYPSSGFRSFTVVSMNSPSLFINEIMAVQLQMKQGSTMIGLRSITLVKNQSGWRDFI